MGDVCGIAQTCMCPRKQSSILCKGCFNTLQSQIVADTVHNMATGESFMEYLNNVDSQCSTLTAYNAQAPQIRTVPLDNKFEEVRAELEERVAEAAVLGAAERVRSRSPISTRSIAQALRQASNQQLLEEISNRMQ